MTVPRLLLHRRLDERPATTPPDADPRRLHEQLPGYRPTPVVEVPAVADDLGVGRVLVKVEAERLGLPSFKMLGASWAAFRAVCEHLGLRPDADLDAVRTAAGRVPGLTLVAATDGNHGRAVARMATILGVQARILVPAAMSRQRVDAIAQEGATVDVVDGSYDEAVTRSAALASDTALVVSDTSWPGYTTVPTWVVDGYSTLFAELDAQLTEHGVTGIDLLPVQVGVGAFATAAVAHVLDTPARVLAVEPAGAACAMASVAAGRVLTVPSEQGTIMAGLDCGTPSALAFPSLQAGVDAFTAIEDDWAEWAVRALARSGVHAGESGAAALAGLYALYEGPFRAVAYEWLGLGPDSVVVSVVTEGVTDRVQFERILGRSDE